MGRKKQSKPRTVGSKTAGDAGVVADAPIQNSVSASEAPVATEVTNHSPDADMQDSLIPQQSQPVIVVGAGVAGLSAAWAALERGSSVVLLERQAHCGGSFRSSAGHIVHPTGESNSLASKWLNDVLPNAVHSAEGIPSSSSTCVSGAVVVRALTQAVLSSSSATVITQACATRLLSVRAGTGPAAVIGCAYRVVEGSITMEKEVFGPIVLCCGGFGGDFSREGWIHKLRPDLLHLPTVCGQNAIGNALALAQHVGACSTELQKVHLTPFALVRPGDEDVKVKNAAPEVLARLGGVILDENGDVLFADCDTDELATSMLRRSNHGVAGKFRLVLPAPEQRNVASPTMDLCHGLVRRGLATRHQSVHSLAKEMEVPTSRLEASLNAAWGRSFDDAECTLQPSDERRTESPLISAHAVVAVRCCMGGLAVDTSGSVLGSACGSNEDSPLPIVGLFAAGEAAADSVSKPVAGDEDALLKCASSGRNAAQAAAAAETMQAMRSASAASVPSRIDDDSTSTMKDGHGTSPCASASEWRQSASSVLAGLSGRRNNVNQSVLGAVEDLLEHKLSDSVLQTALGHIQERGGSFDAAVAELRNAILGQQQHEGTPSRSAGQAFNFAMLDNSASGPGALPTPTNFFHTAEQSVTVHISCVNCRVSVPVEVDRVAAPDDEGKMEVGAGDGPSVVSHSSAAAVPIGVNGDGRGKYAYATLLYGSKVEYFLGALVTGFSLWRTGSNVDRILLYTEDVHDALLDVLKRFWTLRQVEYLEGSSRLYKNYANSRFKAVFTKLQALGCTDYDKVLMLDLDMLVRANLDSLFELPTPAAMKRSSGREQPEHGGRFSGEDLWKQQRDDMCSGINAGVMLLQPDEAVYKRMLDEITDHNHPEHLGTYGPEQDYLTRFYCAFIRGEWSHIHARYNYQLMLPDDYMSTAQRALKLETDVVVVHYSGPRVKPWELDRNPGDLDAEGVRRLLEDDSVRDVFARSRGPQRRQGSESKPRERIMDGVLIVDEQPTSDLPAGVQDVMWEWVLALRSCAQELQSDARGGIDLQSIVSSLQAFDPVERPSEGCVGSSSDACVQPA